MKDWFISKGLAYLGAKTNGYKTYLAGVGFILLALAGCAGKLFPDMGLPSPEWDTIVQQFSAGMALFGLGHKLEKILAPSATPTPSDATGTNG